MLCNAQANANTAMQCMAACDFRCCSHSYTLSPGENGDLQMGWLDEEGIFRLDTVQFSSSQIPMTVHSPGFLDRIVQGFWIINAPYRGSAFRGSTVAINMLFSQ